MFCICSNICGLSHIYVFYFAPFFAHRWRCWCFDAAFREADCSWPIQVQPRLLGVILATTLCFTNLYVDTHFVPTPYMSIFCIIRGCLLFFHKTLYFVLVLLLLVHQRYDVENYQGGGLYLSSSSSATISGSTISSNRAVSRIRAHADPCPSFSKRMTLTALNTLALCKFL